MKTTISERIKLCYTQSGARSIRGYAMSLGIPERTIGDVINKGVEPRTQFIVTFLEKNPRIAAEWLLNGIGPQFKDEKLPSSPVTAENSIVNSGSNNTISKSDDSFWKGIVQQLMEKIDHLSARCNDYEEQNRLLKELLDEAKKANN